MPATGDIVYLQHESDVLKNNPLGDPHIRRFPVYTPPGYDDQSATGYPVIFAIPGFTGHGDRYLQGSMFRQPFNEMIDELIAAGKMPPVIYVMPNCLTYYGGSQYVNSSAVGDYEDYIIQELVPLIDANFATSGARGIMGGSSGGIGSFTLAVKHPDVFSAFADHSGDSAFEYCYLLDVPPFITAMEKYDYDLVKFKAVIHDPSVPKDRSFMSILNLLAMAACYSPNPAVEPLGFELPFDIRTGEIYPEIWERWLAFDPVHMVEPYLANLRRLNFIYIDCGKRDQFNLQLGARQLHARLERFEVDHIYEEYNSDHFLLRREQKRKSIPLLADALFS
ncbi:MAG TPA: alpha/beta hydrolase-fold protein [Anaerolineae bacterium]|jgi:enterochelin esterase family protein|nr:alpha/beta hydrolase-fold protein [Anaerolineae bacterium]